MDGTLFMPTESPKHSRSRSLNEKAINDRISVSPTATDQPQSNVQRIKVRPTLTEERDDGRKTTLIAPIGDRGRSATQPNLQEAVRIEREREMELEREREKEWERRNLERNYNNSQRTAAQRSASYNVPEPVYTVPEKSRQPDNVEVNNNKEENDVVEIKSTQDDGTEIYDEKPIEFSKTPILSMFTPRFLIRSLFHTVMSLQYAFMRG